jgi:hypothetical protein
MVPSEVTAVLPVMLSLPTVVSSSAETKLKTNICTDFFLEIKANA